MILLCVSHYFLIPDFLFACLLFVTSAVDYVNIVIEGHILNYYHLFYNWKMYKNILSKELFSYSLFLTALSSPN